MSFEERITEDYRSDWNTPETIIDPLVEFADTRGIGLDPCSNSNSIVPASISWCKENDGLIREWISHLYNGGLAYVNPPYGREIKPWIEKCAREAIAGVEIVALVPARVDTKWFSICFETANAICFWKGRLKFLGAKDPAKFPSALIYWGNWSNNFRLTFEKYGNMVFPIPKKGAKLAQPGSTLKRTET